MKHGLRFLLVEDDDDDFFLTRRILQKAGITDICRVADGRAALDFFGGKGPYGNRRLHPLPDIALIDLKLPGAGGHQIVEGVAGQPQLGGIRLFILSSSGENRDRVRASAAGIQGYLVKPLTPSDLARICGGTPER